MFQKTRLKLTVLFLLIIILISAFFSFLIYGLISQELERNLLRVEMRLKANELGIKLPDPLPKHLEKMRPELRNIRPRAYLLDELNEAKNRVKLYLFLVNGFIFFVSAGAGYFLAGKALRPIEEAMEEQKRFVADASHELRTPLTVLKTTIEVALRDKKFTTQKAKKILKGNLGDIGGLEKLTNTLLALVRQPDGNGLQMTAFKVSTAVAKAIKQVKSLALKKKISLKTELKPRDQIIEADQAALEGLLVILLDNAVKYTPKAGEVRVITKTNREKIMIKVKDTGIGISKEDMPHIFDRFFRVDSARTRTKTDGFGLGLALAKRIVVSHHGTIKASSQVNKGTTMTLRLPLKQTG